MPSITLTIPSSKYSEYKKYFLITYPNQTVKLDSPLTDDQWIKRKIFLMAKNAYLKGKKQEFENTGPVIDDDIITED